MASFLFARMPGFLLSRLERDAPLLSSFPAVGDDTSQIVTAGGGFTIKTISHKLDNFAELRILPLADFHLGDIHSDFKRIQGYIEYIQSNSNVFCILNGDLMDAAIKSSIGDTYGASLQPMAQLEQCVKIFEPIKDKILAVLPGNHEARIYRSDGLDLTQIMCNQLGIGDRYSPASALLFVRFGKDSAQGHHGRKVLYTIYCVHGAGGGRMEGGKINRLMQLASIVDADIYIHSHVHTPAIVRNAFFRTCPGNNSVEKVEKLFVNTGAALEYGGYSEVQSYKPASLETPIIVLDGSKRRMRAVL